MYRVLFLLVLILASCSVQPQAVEPTINVEVTKIVEQTVIVKETVIVTVESIITATPLPPTQTPTAQPYMLWNLDQVVQAFQLAGLEAETPTAMTRADYGAAPMLAVSGIHFFIPSLCADCGGRIMSFDNRESLEITKAYYDDLGKGSAFFFSWTYTRDNILVQINGDLPAETAAKYELALQNLK